jgi:hypothetical protein
MKKALVFVMMAALAVSACKKKKPDEAKSGDDKDMAAMDMKAMDMDAMDMDAMDMKAMDMDAMDMDAMEAGDDPDEGKNLEACKKLYKEHYKKFMPSLEKLGITATVDDIVAAYGADKPEGIERCTKLTAEQLECALKQANPLNARKPCKLKRSIALSAPSKWRKELKPEVKSLDEKARKRMQRWLKGKWVYEDKKWKRKRVLTVDKKGKATEQRFKDGKPDKKEDYEFSFRNALQIHRKWGNTTQTFTFFKLNNKAFMMSSNLLYNVMKLKDKKNFKMMLNSSTALLMKDGKCVVIDLRLAQEFPAECKWGRDQKEKKPALKISYKRGKWTRKYKYFYVKGHLIHKSLWKNKYEKK